jgi:hypothetical protein
VGRIELRRRCLGLCPNATRIKPDRIGPGRHDAHVGDAGLRKHAIGAEKVGDLRALVERENGDGRPLTLGRLQGLDRLPMLSGGDAVWQNRCGRFVAHRQQGRQTANDQDCGRSKTNAKGSSGHRNLHRRNLLLLVSTMPLCRNAVAT